MSSLNFKNWAVNEASPDDYRFKRPFGIAHGVIPEPLQNVAKMIHPQLATKYLDKYKNAFGAINAARGLPHPDELEKINQTQQGYHNRDADFDQKDAALSQQAKNLDRKTFQSNKQAELNNGHPDDPKVRENKYQTLLSSLRAELQRALPNAVPATLNYALNSLRDIASAMTKGGEIEPVKIEDILKVVNQDKSVDPKIKMHYWGGPKTVFETIIMPAFNSDKTTWYNSKGQGKERFPPETVYNSAKLQQSEERWAAYPHKLEFNLIDLIKSKHPLADKGEYKAEVLKKIMHTEIAAAQKSGHPINLDKKDYNTILKWASDYKPPQKPVPTNAPTTPPPNNNGPAPPGPAPSKSPANPNESELSNDVRNYILNYSGLEPGAKWEDMFGKAKQWLKRKKGISYDDLPVSGRREIMQTINDIEDEYNQSSNNNEE